MFLQAQANDLDCVKLPDDFPVQFSSEIYRVGALRRLDKLLNHEADQVFRIHPKYFLFAHPELFRSAYIQHTPEYQADYLHQCRERARFIYEVPRLEVNAQRIWAGDQLSFHYELAARYLKPSMKVLDIACGNGYGSRMLSSSVTEVHGGDIDPENIAQARKLTNEINVQLHIEDITALSFHDSSFDAVVSFETIEHVDDDACLRELYRVLRPGGVLILSTPQNRLGHIPVNTAHLREYSLAEITALCSRYFLIIETIGIKSGRVVIDGDPIGTNSVLICKKELLQK
jgi:2-polyprenyl-3-methyl-5-hydroxy-6-metoxy-1,4-benzoquinol methylase